MRIQLTIADDSVKLSRSIQYHIPIYVYDYVIEQAQVKQQPKDNKQSPKGLAQLLGEPDKPTSMAAKQGRSFTKKFLLGVS